MQFRNKQIDILNDTLHICGDGYYLRGDVRVQLKLNPAEMKNAIVFLPDQIDSIINETSFSALQTEPECVITCENIDSFSMAHKRICLSQNSSNQEPKKILVLNFANPINPGGGVRRGARAQEEDLCRKSTLLLSLESDVAKEYYLYNRDMPVDTASDAIILSPTVEVFRGDKAELINDSFVVSVMTCAAPRKMDWVEELPEQEYAALFYNRIVHMLKCAACWGYKSLVLGAFGCGAFNNDAAMVSDLFHKAFHDLGLYAKTQNKLFHSIDFAVLDQSYDQYNFKQFCRNFS